MSIDRIRSATTSERTTTGDAQAHQTRMALSGSQVTTTTGNQALGDDGDENHGVRRGRSLDLGDLD